MAVSGKNRTDTFTALEAMDVQYVAVALDDGKVANNGEEAYGILQMTAKANDFVTVAVEGMSKFLAGGAITAGGKITVTTSGYFVAGDSGSYIVGECRNTVTSGSIGTGQFDFATAPYLPV